MTNLIEDAIAALRQVETLETREVHVGYENGMTSQAYVYEDYLPAKDVLAIVNATLARLEQAKGRAENETAWLIERDDIATVESGNRVCLHYYGEWRKGSHYWTPDHAKAKRFAMADEAMKETNGDPLLRVAEHMWMAVEQASSGEAGELVACSRCGGADMLMCDCSLPSRFAAPVAPQPVERPQDHWTVKALIKAGNALSCMAQTTGGTAGPDPALQAAIAQWDSVRRIVKYEGDDPAIGAGSPDHPLRNLVTTPNMAYSNPVQDIDPRDCVLRELFAETAILLTHPDPSRAALAKKRVYAMIFATPPAQDQKEEG